MFKKIIICSFAAALLMALPGYSFAKIEKGDQEVAVDGSITSFETGSSETGLVNIGVSYGVFFTDAWQIGISGDFLRTVTRQMATIKTSVNGFAKYHFCTETNVVPYLGVQAGFTNTDYDYTDIKSTSSASFGGMGGIKWFIKENISFYTELNFSKQTGESSETTTSQGLFGLAIYF